MENLIIASLDETLTKSWPGSITTSEIHTFLLLHNFFNKSFTTYLGEVSDSYLGHKDSKCNKQLSKKENTFLCILERPY